MCFSLLSEQKRNTSLTSSNSLKELLQRKISTLEQQLHHSNAGPGGPERHSDDRSHGDEKEHHDDSEHHHSDEHESDHKEGGDGDNHSHHHERHEGDGDHENEAEGHGLVSHTGSRAPGKTGFHSTKLDSMLNQLHLAGTQTHTLPTETAPKPQELSRLPRWDPCVQLVLLRFLLKTFRLLSSKSRTEEAFWREGLTRRCTQRSNLGWLWPGWVITNVASPEAALSKRKLKSADAFPISFPMRSNYMYGRVKKTLLQEIFALTLCVWIKAGVGPGMGTPFSYSAPGQANELVLIEWGSNPMELLVNDKVRKNTGSRCQKHTSCGFSNPPPPQTRLWRSPCLWATGSGTIFAWPGQHATDSGRRSKTACRGGLGATCRPGTPSNLEVSSFWGRNR